MKSLSEPMLHLDASEADKRLRAWFDDRGISKRFPWRDARWLRRCPPHVVADAAAWIKSGEAATSASINEEKVTLASTSHNNGYN